MKTSFSGQRQERKVTLHWLNLEALQSEFGLKQSGSYPLKIIQLKINLNKIWLIKENLKTTFQINMDLRSILPLFTQIHDCTSCPCNETSFTFMYRYLQKYICTVTELAIILYKPLFYSSSPLNYWHKSS